MATGMVLAERRIIPLQVLTQTYDGDRGHIRHTPIHVRLPVVEKDANQFFLKDLQAESNIIIKLTDVEGNIIYQVSLVASENMTFVISKLNEEKVNSIIIIANGITYVGEI